MSAIVPKSRTGYAFFHATRKTFSNVKTTISQEWTPSHYNETQCNNETCQPYLQWNARTFFKGNNDDMEFLGVLDAAFMISYAVGLYISGIIGDRFNMRIVLSFGMCSSALCVFIFGFLLEKFHVYNVYLYTAIWVLNGLLQSTGWPTVVAVMGNWFGKSSRGLVLGIWSACASVGNIIGALMVSAVLDYGYDYAFLLPSSVLFAGGIIMFFALIPSPREVGIHMPDEEDHSPTEYTVNARRNESVGYEKEMYMFVCNTEFTEPLLGSETEEEIETVEDVKTEVTKRPDALSFRQALCLPGVILYALAYACLKLVNYSFFFWLPYYLSHALHWKETVADDISIWYDVGGIIGGTIAGFISVSFSSDHVQDRFEKRTVIVIPMLVLAIPALFGYSQSPDSLTINGVLMAVVGFFIGGVANLISAAISADLGRQGPVQGNKEALATVTGIIDGTGSVGAAIGQLMVPAIQKKANGDWVPVFIFFMIMTFLTMVCIFPLFIREVKSLTHGLRFSWFRGCHRDQSLYPDYREDQEEEDENH